MFQANETFHARSGRTVRMGEDGTVMFDGANGYLSPQTAMDAEEFMQAKRDADLLRWRWPENPDFVVYKRGEGVRVLDETTGDNWYYRHDEIACSGISYDAACAYWEAHPVEPKPTADEIVAQLRAWSDDPRPTRERLVLGHAANTIEDLRRGRR